MVTFVLDASALLRLLDGEAGEARVAEVLQLHADGLASAVVPAIHWGEVAGVLHKRQIQGLSGWQVAWSRLNGLKIEAIPATTDRSVRSALIHTDLKIPYVDSFAVELASAPDHVLVTADFDFKPAAESIAIEFLPAKSKP